MGQSARFERVDSGMYALREWNLSIDEPSVEVDPPQSKPKPPEISPEQLPNKHLSFADAAERILDEQAEKKPMHYRDITEKMLASRLVQTKGQTPEATLYAQILTEIKRQTRRGDTPRFVKYGKGYVGLSKWMGQGLA